MNFKTIKPPYQLVPLKTKGLTNDLFLVNNQYFLKQSKDISQPFLNLTNQLNVIKLIQWETFTLPITEVKISNNKLLTLMPYYHNLMTLGQQPIYNELLKHVSLLVKQLHQIPLDTNLKIITWDTLSQFNLYCNLIVSEINLDNLKEKVITWISSYQPEKIALCHNDLTLNNFVKENNHWHLIDWDFACWNDELFDIASFASESLTNENDVNFWFSCFDLNNEQIAIVKKWMIYQDLIWYYWACYLYDQTKLEVYKEIGNSKLKMLLKQTN